MHMLAAQAGRLGSWRFVVKKTVAVLVLAIAATVPLVVRHLRRGSETEVSASA